VPILSATKNMPTGDNKNDFCGSFYYVILLATYHTCLEALGEFDEIDDFIYSNNS